MATLQQPVQSPFNAASTAAEVMAGIDLRGQLAVVTGGYSGLGLLTVKSLAAAGAQIIVPARGRRSGGNDRDGWSRTGFHGHRHRAATARP